LEFKPFYGILVVSRGNDDTGLVEQGFEKFEAIKFGQINVEKHDIYWILAHYVEGFDGIEANVGKLEERRLVDVFREDFCGQRFIFYDDTFKGLGERGAILLFIGQWVRVQFLRDGHKPDDFLKKAAEMYKKRRDEGRLLSTKAA